MRESVRSNIIALHEEGWKPRTEHKNGMCPQLTLKAIKFCQDIYDTYMPIIINSFPKDI